MAARLKLLSVGSQCSREGFGVGMDQHQDVAGSWDRSASIGGSKRDPEIKQEYELYVGVDV